MPDLSALDLARAQFALTAGLHFLLVATTLGIAPLLAVLQTAAALRRDPLRRAGLARARDALLRLYLINYGAGIVTGLILELQMGLNWSRVPAELYDPIATTLASETLLAFLLESTMLGLFLASEGRFPAGVRAALLWGVAATAWLSASLIVSANAYLHRPGAVLHDRDGAMFVDPVTLLANPSAIAAVLHIAAAAAAVAGAWAVALALAVARRESPTSAAAARPLARAGALLLALGSPATVITGIAQFSLARATLEVDTPAYAGIALALMMLAGLLLTGLSWLLAIPLLLWRGGGSGGIPAAGVAAALLPFVPLGTTFLGWLYRETARQPWMIVGEVTTAEALSVQSVPLLATTTIVFVGLDLVAVLGAWVLILRGLGRPTVVPRPGWPGDDGSAGSARSADGRAGGAGTVMFP